MKKRTSLFLIFFSIVFNLISCNASTNNINEKLNYSLLCPVGAPALPLYYEILKEDNVNTTSTPSGIPSEFSKGDFDFLVFDSTKATPLLKKSENPLYEFSLMLTGGSFHLLGFNKTNESLPLNGENVYSFQENGTADKLFKYIYSKDTEILNYTYFDSISNLQSILLNLSSDFKINDQTIDWAVVSEPQLTNLKNKWQNSGIDLKNVVDINLSQQFKIHNQDWEYDYIPQAALYVKKTFKEENSEKYKKIIERIKSTVSAAIEKPSVITSSMNEFYTTEEVQKSTFGFSSSTLLAVQDNQNNGFGIVPNDYNELMDDSVISNFNQILNS